jgi:putative transcriptional regulator
MTIKIHLSRILGEKRIKVADLARRTGISRRGLDKIYHEETGGIKFNVLAKLCEALEVSVGEILEYVPKDDKHNKKA